MGELCQGRVLCQLRFFYSMFFSSDYSGGILQGVLDHYFPLASRSAVAQHPVSVDLLVDGSVPAGSGLSSSAAMVVASTLAFLAVNGKLDKPGGITKGKLVEISMENERRVGK